LSIPSEPSEINTATPKTNAFWRVIPWLRWLLVPYFIIIVLCGFFTIAIAGYGLAHGSSESNKAFFALVFGVMLGAAVLPLSFLLKSQAIWARVLQVIGMVVFAVVLFIFSKIMFYLFIEPAIWTAQFKLVTDPIAIESVTETPVLLDGTPIGLTVTTNVKLPKAVALDRYGAVVLDTLSSLQLSAPELTGGNRMAPFADGLQASVTLDGKPIEYLPGMKEYRALSYGVIPDGKSKLPAGIYQVSQTFWLNGLRRPDLNDYSDTNPTPCKIEAQDQNPAYIKQYEQHLKDSNNTPLAVSISGRLSLRDRNGYRYFGRTAPIKYRYNHAEWTKTLAALPLQTCKAVDAAKQARETAKAAIKKAEDDKAAYDDGHLFYKENPLYTEACAGNSDAINKRMQAETLVDGIWVPRFALSDIMRDCSITKPQIAIFKQLAPSLYTRSKLGLANGENEYCDVLGELHTYRNLPFLSALAELKLPLDCTSKEMWRRGIGPLAIGTQHSGYSNEEEGLILAAANRDDGPAWVKLLVENHIDICKPETLNDFSNSSTPTKVPGKTLLDKIVHHNNPEIIQAVLDAGCSPHSQVKLAPGAGVDAEGTLPAGVWWTFRRHRIESDTATSPINTSNAALIAKLDRKLTPKVAELTGSAEYASIFVANRRIVEDSDIDLLAALVKTGLKLDYANEHGNGWFYPAYGNDWNPTEAKRYFAMLDKLTDAQLKQLINPVTSTGKPSEPMYGLKKPEFETQEKPFRNYVCKRKVMVCD
jgi:hypothetical protein